MRENRGPARRPAPRGGAGNHDRTNDTPGRQRLDKWLVYARFVRTRAGAAELIEGGSVRVAGRRVGSASRLVGPGDVLTLALPQGIRVVRVTGLPERRGPFVEARQLYEDLGLECPTR